jgi:hypothetical protein
MAKKIGVLRMAQILNYALTTAFVVVVVTGLVWIISVIHSRCR